MRGILVEVRPANSKLFSVPTDPLPQTATPRASLPTRPPLKAHEIGRKPMSVAPAAAPAVIRAIGRSLVAGCDLLSVVIAECAGDARRKPGRFHRVKRIIQLPSEVLIHASDHVIL